MKSNNMLHFIEEIIPAGNLVEGVDFEIISFFVYDLDEDDFCTIGRYYSMDTSSILFKIKSDSVAKDAILQEITTRTGITSIDLLPTPFPENPLACFYKLNSPIDYDTAISLGFGIVRLLKPNKENEFLLYNFRSLVENDDDLIIDRLEEIGLLKCYLQLTEKGKFHDPTLEDFLDEYGDMVYSSVMNPYEMFQRILMAIDKNKGELFVFSRS